MLELMHRVMSLEVGIPLRATLNLDDALIAKSAELTGITEKSQLARLGLLALIAQESARRLARFSGSDPTGAASPRRRMS